MRAALINSMLAAVLAAAGAGIAQAQNTFQQQIRSRLASTADTIRAQGYYPDREMMAGSLNEDARDTMVITLRGGTRYAIIGVCDEDCRDVDLRIWGPDGTKIDEDVEVDSTPVLEFVAPVTGRYRLSVEMPNCRVNPCYWGVQVFAR